MFGPLRGANFLGGALRPLPKNCLPAGGCCIIGRFDLPHKLPAGLLERAVSCKIGAEHWLLRVGQKKTKENSQI